MAAAARRVKIAGPYAASFFTGTSRSRPGDACPLQYFSRRRRQPAQALWPDNIRKLRVGLPPDGRAVARLLTMSYHIYKNLSWLNELPTDEAEATFLDCCGSSEWARRMVAGRPYPMLEDLYATAEKTWF